MLDTMILYSDYIGLIGVVLTLVAYYLINVGKVSSMNLTYLLLNLIGSCMLLFSLLFHWNLASVVIEIAWISISFIGMIRFYKAQV